MFISLASSEKTFHSIVVGAKKAKLRLDGVEHRKVGTKYY